MNRRSFLAALAGAFAIDPERGLWTPGAKLISIPAAPALMEVVINAHLDAIALRYHYTIQPRIQPQGRIISVDIQVDAPLGRSEQIYIEVARRQLSNMLAKVGA